MPNKSDVYFLKTVIMLVESVAVYGAEKTRDDINEFIKTQTPCYELEEFETIIIKMIDDIEKGLVKYE